MNNELDLSWRNRDLSLKVDSLERKLEIATSALEEIKSLCNQVLPISKDIYSLAREALLQIEEPKKVDPKPIEKTETPKKRGRPRTSRALF